MARPLSQQNTAYLKRCRQRIGAAKRYRDKEKLDARWKRLIDLYNGKHFPKALSAEDKIVVNMAFSTINVIAPSVAVNHPKIVVNARRPEFHDQSEMVEGVVNYWWTHFDLQDELRAAVNDFLIIGHGWLKTGYRFVEEEQPDTEAMSSDYKDLKGQKEDYAKANPDLANSLPDDEEVLEGVEYKTAMVVKEDRPFVERISPSDVYVDPDATSLRDARWIAQKCIKTLEEVRNDDAYDTSARNAVEPDSQQNQEWRPVGVPDKELDFQRVTVWEYYDLANGQMCTFAETGDLFLVKPTDQPYDFGQPFVMLRNYDVPDAFYPMGELEAIECLQQELNMTRTAILNDRKQKQRAWIVDERAFDKAGKRELASDRDNRVVYTNGSVPINEAIIPLPSQQLDAQLYQNSDMIENDINVITGVNEYARGELPEGRRTATEASIIQDAMNARAADKLAKVESIISVVARRLVLLAQQYMTEEDVARVEGPNGTQVWFTFKPEDIQGEYEFDVEGGSTQPKNDTARRQTAMSLLQALSPFMDPQMGIINAQELIRYCLQYGFDVSDPDKFMGQGPPPPPQQPPPPASTSGAQPTPDGPTGPPGPPGMPQPQQGGPQGVPADMGQMLAGLNGGEAAGRASA